MVENFSKFCACGCGEKVSKPENRFIHGHYIRTEDHKKRQSKILKEYYEKHVHHTKGKKFSAERNKKVSRSLKEKHKTDKEFHEKMCHILYQHAIDNAKSKEIREKIRNSVSKYNQTPDARKHLSIKLREYHKNHKNGFFGKHHTEKTKKLLSIKNSGRLCGDKNPSKRPEVKEKLSKLLRTRWLDDKFVKKVAAGLNIKPNKPETQLLRILKRNFVGWEYSGNLRKTIEGKSPDFINEEKKQIIELFGDYWHRGQTGEKRKLLFKRNGYDCLIVWEHELENKNKLIERLKDFAK